MKWWMMLVLLAGVAMPAMAQDEAQVSAEPEATQPATPTPPAWFTAHVDFMTRGSGEWVSENPPGYDDPDEPDQIGMRWESVNGGYGLVGRMYGLENGEKTREFYAFREFWHPGERRAVIEQWGWVGIYGTGHSTMIGNDQGVADQTFWLPDGRSWRETHRTREEGDRYYTDSYDVDEDGHWTVSDARVWDRVAEADG